MLESHKTTLLSLRSEISQLEGILSLIPVENVLERKGFEHRLIMAKKLMSKLNKGHMNNE